MLMTEFKRTFLQALLSKIVTAAITTPVFSFLLGFLMSNPFGERATYWQGYLTDIIQITPIYMLYSFPVILVYGGLTSLLSDFLATNMAAYTVKRMELLYAALFHLGFGLILLKISLLAAFVYFMVDRFIVANNTPFTTRKMSISLLILIGSWLLFMTFIWIRGQHLQDRKVVIITAQNQNQCLIYFSIDAGHIDIS